MKSDNGEVVPQYWERLSDEDKETYSIMRKSLASSSCKNQRNRSKENFSDIISGLKTFIMRGDEQDRNRMLVCGICWLSNERIAINTRQLRIIMSKCKSSINGSFQSLGYGTVPSGADSSSDLLSIFPEFKNNYTELRQWTVRQPLASTPTPRKLQQMLLMNYNTREFVTPPPSKLPQPPLAPNGMSLGCSMLQQQMLYNTAQQMMMNIPPPPSMAMSAPPPSMTMSAPPQTLPREPEFPDKLLDSPEPIPSFENDDFANFNWGDDDLY